MNDLIKRDSVLATIGVMYERCGGDLTDYRDLMLEIVKVLPSVDIPHSDDWEKYSDKLWKTAYERGKADRPSGEVNAVKLYEDAISDLEHNKITLGEYEKQIEPLTHLYYDRPSGFWTKVDVATYICSECGKKQIADDINELNFCCCCGSRNKVRRKGADDE